MQMTPPIDLRLHHHQLKSVSQSVVVLPLPLPLPLPSQPAILLLLHDLSSSRAQKMSARCPERASERIAASNQTFQTADFAHTHFSDLQTCTFFHIVDVGSISGAKGK